MSLDRLILKVAKNVVKQIKKLEVKLCFILLLKNQITWIEV